jgi:hypothetical protein
MMKWAAPQLLLLSEVIYEGQTSDMEGHLPPTCIRFIRSTGHEKCHSPMLDSSSSYRKPPHDSWQNLVGNSPSDVPALVPNFPPSSVSRPRLAARQATGSTIDTGTRHSIRRLRVRVSGNQYAPAAAGIL